MKMIAWLLAHRGAVSLNTAIARQRLAATMPGETGAINAFRLDYRA